MGFILSASGRIVSSVRHSVLRWLFSRNQNRTNVLYSPVLKEYSSLHGVVTTTTSANNTDEALSFRSLLSKNLQQAHRTVVVEVPSPKTLSEASKFIEESGAVKEILHFTSKSRKEFIIAEFSDVDAVKVFLCRCRSLPRIGEIPTFSRILKYVDESDAGSSSEGILKVHNCKIDVQAAQNCEVKDKIFSNVTDVMENVLREEKLTDVESRLRFFVCTQISDAFHGLFRHCEVLPFGSSVNGLGFHFSDLDTVLVFYGKKEVENSGLYFPTKQHIDVDYEQKILKTVANILDTFLVGVVNTEAVYRARVPLLKFYHELFELNCDLSLCNMSGVEMSEILYNCVLLDSRVRPLAFAIKRWAKMATVTSDIGTHAITNFSLFQLLIFFLQTRPFPILPPLCQVCEIKNHEGNLAAVCDFKSNVSNKETLGDLLKGFFLFIKDFNFAKTGISTYHGKISKKDYSPLFIENPLDKELNVSRNVTKNSLYHLKQAASSAHKYLEGLSENSGISNLNFWEALSSQHHV